MEKLSGSRVLHELELIFREEDPRACLMRLQELKVLPAMAPQLDLTADRIRLLEQLSNVLDWYRLLYTPRTPDTTQLYLLALNSGLSAADAEALCRRLGIDAADCHEFLNLRERIRITMQELTALHAEKGEPRISRVCTLLAGLPLEAHLYLMARAVNEAVTKSISQYIYKWQHIRLDISGADLLDLGIPPGPAFGLMLRQLLAAKQDGRLPGREEQLEMAQHLAKREGKGTRRASETGEHL